MSTSVHWRPIAYDSKQVGDYGLKKALLRYTDQDSGFDTVLDESDLAYLFGLRDGGVDGADALISAINKHRRIRVFTE